MDTQSSQRSVSCIFPSLGPALIISMGYIDLGKWVAAVDGGGRCGSDLILPALVFNFISILCQYLASCVGTVTGMDLAKICSQEYSRLVCILLGIQAEISIIISDLTMILGVAYGLNILFGMELVACIFFATAGTALIPFLVTFLDNRRAEVLYISIAGSTLFFYVLGVLISQPEIPLVMNGGFPKLGGDCACSLMVLLGANVMAHNFYVHSSIVQQRKPTNVSINALFHDQFFTILFLFACIFVVNYVLMNSAANVFGASEAFTGILDISLLMDQIFRSPISPWAFLLVLLFSSQIMSLSWDVGGQVIVRYFFDINLPVWSHHVITKVLVIIPALCYTGSAGAEGLYQLLILSQIILAMLLPSSVIPLFRISSSKVVMGNFKISWHTEIFTLLAFLVVLSVNVVFISELFSGNGSLTFINKDAIESSMKLCYTSFLVIAGASALLTLYLAVTPLKSSTVGLSTQTLHIYVQKDQLNMSRNRGDDGSGNSKCDYGRESSVKDEYDRSIEGPLRKSVLEANANLVVEAFDSGNDSHQSIHEFNSVLPCISLANQIDESKPLVEVEQTEEVESASAVGFSDSCKVQTVEMKDPHQKDVEVITCTRINKGDEESVQHGALSESLIASTSECAVSSFSPKGDTIDVCSSPGSRSKLSGLGRAARRQLTVVLDEFWGHLFDFHGKLTPEASTRRINILLGLDLRTSGSSGKADNFTDETLRSFSDANRGSSLSNYPRPKQRAQNTEMPFGLQMGSQPWSQSMQGLNTDMPASINDVLGRNERIQLYPSHYSNNRDYQPATIHGYQITSYLKEIGAGRNPYASSNLLDPFSTKSSSFISNTKDPFMYTHDESGMGMLDSSVLQRHVPSRMSTLQAEKPFYEPSSPLGTAENVASLGYTKKYHTAPDISSIISSLKNLPLSSNGNNPCFDPISPRSSLDRTTYGQSRTLNPISRGGVSFAFDEVSSSNLQRDAFPSHQSLNMDSKSLWSRQPYEQLFGVSGKDQLLGRRSGYDQPNIIRKESFSYNESELKMLQSLRFCIIKLLKLEGSDWLFKQNGGKDEEIIDRVAAAERHLHQADSLESNCINFSQFQNLSSDRDPSTVERKLDSSYPLSVPNCGDDCVWRALLVVSFGVWCVRRILELSLVESRPELWGKYTYVLNRLQGILDPAFAKPRQSLGLCSCLELPLHDVNSSKTMQNELLSGRDYRNSAPLTTASMILELIKDVETAVSSRKGRTGTAAGDIAFPKGKENLASVLKRYKRSLLSKSVICNK